MSLLGYLAEPTFDFEFCRLCGKPTRIGPLCGLCDYLSQPFHMEITSWRT